MEVTDLKVIMTVSIASKEVVETPSLRGNIKITHKSKDVLDIQAVTLEYLDEAGKPIPYKSDERIVKVNPFWKALQPEGTTEGSLDVTIPMNAIKVSLVETKQVDLDTEMQRAIARQAEAERERPGPQRSWLPRPIL